MPLKRAVTEFGKTYKDRFALRTYPGTSVPIFIFILGWSRTKPRVTLSAQTMMGLLQVLRRHALLRRAVAQPHLLPGTANIELAAKTRTSAAGASRDMRFAACVTSSCLSSTHNATTRAAFERNIQKVRNGHLFLKTRTFQIRCKLIK